MRYPCSPALHLLQSALVDVHAAVQQVLTDSKRADSFTGADWRPCPRCSGPREPYGRFELDMNRRFDLDLAAWGAAVPGSRTSGGGPAAASGGPVGPFTETQRVVPTQRWGYPYRAPARCP